MEEKHEHKIIIIKYLSLFNIARGKLSLVILLLLPIHSTIIIQSNIKNITNHKNTNK